MRSYPIRGGFSGGGVWTEVSPGNIRYDGKVGVNKDPSVTNDLQLTDAAGADSFIVRDSGAVGKLQVLSNGYTRLNNNIDLWPVSVSTLRFYRVSTTTRASIEVGQMLADTSANADLLQTFGYNTPGGNDLLVKLRNAVGGAVILRDPANLNFLKIDKSGTLSIIDPLLGGEYIVGKPYSASVTLSGAGPWTINLNVPGTDELKIAQLVVEEAITGAAGGATDWSAAYSGGSTQSIATAQSFAENTKVDKIFDVKANSATAGSARNIQISLNAGTVTGGKITALVRANSFISLDSFL